MACHDFPVQEPMKTCDLLSRSWERRYKDSPEEDLPTGNLNTGHATLLEGQRPGSRVPAFTRLAVAFFRPTWRLVR